MHFTGSETSLSMDSENSNSTETDVKEFRKKLRNRQSAQRARDRQKARLRWLEREVAILTVKNQALQAENVALRNMIDNGKPQPPAHENVRMKETLPIKKRAQAKPDEKSFYREQEEASSLSRKRPNNDFVPGRIQGKLKIINSENDKPYTAIDRVAVISPISRNDGCGMSLSNQDMYPVKGLKVSTKHNQNIDQVNEEKQKNKTNFVAECIKPNRDTQRNYLTDKKDPPLPESVMDYARVLNNNMTFNFPPKPGFVTSNYESLISGGLYPLIYPQGLVNFLPQPAMTAPDLSNKTGDDFQKVAEMQKTIKLLQEANTISDFVKKQQSSFNPELLSTIYPSGFASTGIPITTASFLSPMMLSSNPQLQGSNVTSLENGKYMKDQGKAGLMRQKMNSFESECSSQISSESDLHSMSP